MRTHAYARAQVRKSEYKREREKNCVRKKTNPSTRCNRMRGTRSDQCSSRRCSNQRDISRSPPHTARRNTLRKKGAKRIKGAAPEEFRTNKWDAPTGVSKQGRTKSSHYTRGSRSRRRVVVFAESMQTGNATSDRGTESS